MQWLNSWVRKILWRRDRLPTPVFLGFPGGSDGKESACNAADLGLIPGTGRSAGEGNSYHSSILDWRLPWTEEPGGLHTICGVTKSWTRLSDSNFHALSLLPINHSCWLGKELQLWAKSFLSTPPHNTLPPALVTYKYFLKRIVYVIICEMPVPLP